MRVVVEIDVNSDIDWFIIKISLHFYEEAINSVLLILRFFDIHARRSEKQTFILRIEFLLS